VKELYTYQNARYNDKKESSATCLQEPHIWCYAIQILISTYAFEYHRFEFFFLNIIIEFCALAIFAIVNT